MLAPQALVRLIVSRVLPLANPDSPNVDVSMRGGRYGEQYVQSISSTKHLLADEGSYFVSTNPTVGTAFADSVSASFSDTVPFAYLFNKSTAGNLRIYLDYLKLICTVAPVSGTNTNFAIILDSVARFPTTNNMTTVVPVSPNSDLSPASQLQLLIQNSATASAVAASSGVKRIVARGALGQQPLVGDEIIIAFGQPDQSPYQGLTATEAAAFSRRVSVCPPVILGPQTSAVLHLWFASNATTGASFEFEMGHWER